MREPDDAPADRADIDSLSNLAAHQRMTTQASDPRLIIPGHDPQVFVRFPSPGNGVARLQLPK